MNVEGLDDEDGLDRPLFAHHPKLRIHAARLTVVQRNVRGLSAIASTPARRAATMKS